MALVSLQEISKQYDYTPILTQLSLHLNPNERIAIVGKNGSGKSTLLKIVAGELEVDEGEWLASLGIEIKMLPQKPFFPEGMRVREAIEEELKELKEAKKEWDRISEALAKDSENKELLRHSLLTYVKKRLAEMELISPLCANVRKGCASFHFGKVFVEKR